MKNKKTLFLILLFLVAIGVTLPGLRPANAVTVAQVFGALFGGTLTMIQGANPVAGAIETLINVVMVVPYAVLLIVSAVFSFISTNLLKIVIAISTHGVSYTNNIAAQVGWPIVRDFANIIVVLGFIGIALATILRWPAEYDAKSTKILPKLILAALLINFSLVICGVIIDISNAAMNYFLNSAGNRFTDYVNTQAFQNIGNVASGIGNNSPLVFGIKVASNVVFNLISGIVMFLFAFLFLFRIMALWILVILSPLAFICAVFPITQEFYQKWKSNFIQWCIIGIPGALFLYLGEQINIELIRAPVNVLGSAINSSPLPGATGITGDPATEILKQLTGLFTFFIPSAFLVLGFLFSIQTSAMGANFAITAGKKVGFAYGKWTGKATAAGGLLGAKGVVGGAAGATGFLGGGVRGAWTGWRSGAGIWQGARTGAASGWQGGINTARRAKDTAKTVGAGALSAGRWVGTAGDRALEKAGYNEEGEQNMIERQRKNKAVEDSRKLSEDRSQAQIMASVDSTPTTDSARAQKASDIQIAFEKGWINSSTHPDVGQRMALASRAAADGGSWDKIIGSMSAEDSAHILQNNMFSGKAQEEALKRLKTTNLMSLLSSGELVGAITNMKNRGSDISDILKAIPSNTLAEIITESQGSLNAPALDIFDEETRRKITEALADRRQLDQIGEIGEAIAERRQRKLDAIREAAEHGGVPQDLVEKMNSDDKAAVLNDPALLLNHLTGQQANDVVGKTTASLAKSGELHLIQPGTRKNGIFEQAIQGGFVGAEELEEKSYRGAGFNVRRLMNLGGTEAEISAGREALRTPVGTRTAAQNAAAARLYNLVSAAENQVLDERMDRMKGDELRDIDPARLTGGAAFQRIVRLTPKQISEFATVPPGPNRLRVLNAIHSHETDLQNEINRLNALGPQRDQRRANILREKLTTIQNLPII